MCIFLADCSQGYTWYGGHTLLNSENDQFSCDPSRKWVEEANSDLVRFLDIRQVEHVTPIGAAAMQELLVTKCYDFEKPNFLKSGSNLQILGDGTQTGRPDWLAMANMV